MTIEQRFGEVRIQEHNSFVWYGRNTYIWFMTSGLPYRMRGEHLFYMPQPPLW